MTCHSKSNTKTKRDCHQLHAQSRVVKDEQKDDRVELIRQAFTCLKPKEIKCLVPDFLQGKSIEFLQEQCLDEVLGISTKRLLSIINSTKCPTDTESSSDEDEKIVEHISLDEISSDSDVEIAKPIAKKGKSKDVKAKKEKEPEVKPNDKPNKNGGKKSEKEMTVLELLELQARARAIRSQLALEPITKIELDSDQDGENDSDTEKTTKKSNDVKAKSDNTNSTKQSKSISPDKEQPKRVRLKRNFRIRQVGDEELSEEPSQTSAPEQQAMRKSRSKSKEKEPEQKPLVNEQTKAKEEIQETKSRDSSPEVIPVIPSPETLCISSDSEDEKAKKAKSSIFVDNIEELEKQIKEKQAQIPATKPDHKDEPEEGELTEEDKSPQRNRKESAKSIETNGENAVVKSPAKTTILDQEEELDYEVREISDSEPEANNDDSTKTEKEDVEEKRTEEKDESESESDSSEDEPKDQSSSDDEDEEHDPDVVEIHDSSDENLLEQKLAEDETEKSWGSRWLESKRVAKVMAASRLGNKVRDKLKKKKQKEQQEQQELEREAARVESPEPPKEPEMPTNVEEGSVEHYKKLVAKAGGGGEREATSKGNEGAKNAAVEDDQ